MALAIRWLMVALAVNLWCWPGLQKRADAAFPQEIVLTAVCGCCDCAGDCCLRQSGPEPEPVGPAVVAAHFFAEVPPCPSPLGVRHTYSVVSNREPSVQSDHGQPLYLLQLRFLI